MYIKGAYTELVCSPSISLKLTSQFNLHHSTYSITLSAAGGTSFIVVLQ